MADLHGARDKFERQGALDAFRRGKAQVLIASDIAARGLDVSGVDLVINIDAPSQSRDYLHRAGRTGRANTPGFVLNLLTEAELRLARRYAEDLNISVDPVRMVRGNLVPDNSDTSSASPHQRSAPYGRKGPAQPSKIDRTDNPRPSTREKAESRTGTRPGSQPDSRRSSKPAAQPTEKPSTRPNAARPRKSGPAKG